MKTGSIPLVTSDQTIAVQDHEQLLNDQLSNYSISQLDIARGIDANQVNSTGGLERTNVERKYYDCIVPICNFKE